MVVDYSGVGNSKSAYRLLLLLLQLKAANLCIRDPFPSQAAAVLLHTLLPYLLNKAKT